MTATYYELLRVPPDASEATIRARYIELARRHHPDAHSTDDPVDRARAEKRMQRINEAYGVLSDPVARRRYDETFGPAQPERRTAPSAPNARPDYDPDDFDPIAVAGPVDPMVWLIRVAPIVLLLLVFLGIFVATAFIGPSSEPVPRPGSSGPDLDEGPLAIGDCVDLRDGLVGVPCSGATGRIVGYVPPGQPCSTPNGLAVVVPGFELAACVEFS